MAGPAVNTQVNSTNEITHNKVDAYEVGWMFVQQYFTFLNSSPDRLYCFYSPSCQFIRGSQGEAASTCVGQKDIRERIKSYGYTNCKVLISNIDVQSTRGDLILIQVVGELENKGESQRFVQLFTLEESANGFSIINDILRFIPESSASKSTSAPASEPISAPEPVPAPAKAPAATEQPAPTEKVNKVTPSKPTETPKPAATPAAAVAAEPKEKDATPPANATPPSGPKTWASRVASQADQKQTKVSPNASTPTVSTKSSAVASPQNDSKPAVSTQKDSSENALSYIQLRVKETISKKALHEVLSVHGPISHLDIKNGVAYVDFQNSDSASKAIAQGKFTIGSETLIAEPRNSTKRFNGPSNNAQYNYGHGSDSRRGGYGSQSRRTHGGPEAPSPDRANFDQKSGSFNGPRRGGSHNNGPRNNTRNNRPSAQEGPKQA